MEIAIMIISIIITSLTIPYIRNMLIKTKFTGENYKGESIPTGMGITFIPVMLINFIILIYFLQEIIDTVLVFLVSISIMAFVGIIDDLLGNRNSSGFKGHFLSFFKGQLTTGFLKAIIGGLIALIISLTYSKTLVEIIVNSFIIALFANLLNLLDLRPGRAMKSYLFLAFLFTLLGITYFCKVILFSIVGYCVGYLPQDLKAKSMMGDVGSNSLGITLGIISVISFSIGIKYIIFSTLLFMHLMAERYSLSKVIENNILLNFFDKLGQNLK